MESRGASLPFNLKNKNKINFISGSKDGLRRNVVSHLIFFSYGEHLLCGMLIVLSYHVRLAVDCGIWVIILYCNRLNIRFFLFIISVIPLCGKNCISFLWSYFLSLSLSPDY